MYITFKELDKYNLINLYSKKPYNFNFHVLSDDEINNEILKLEDELGIKFKGVVIPRQSHTNNIAVIDESNMNDEYIDIDGLITNVKGIALCTMSADCQNLYLYDPIKEVIGCVHSGWRGTYNEISKEAVNKMVEVYGCNPFDIEVVIGPSIMKCCFEVSEDVKIQFEEKFGNKFISLGDIKNGEQKYFIDTVGIQEQILNSVGVNKIYKSNVCVKCEHDQFHSYRGDGKDAGRNIALISMR